MAQQLGLDLPSRPALGRDDFFVAPSNAIAVAMIEGWQAWAGRKMVLTGPPGSGKTHLAHVWANLSGAGIIDARDIATGDIPALAQGPLAVENVPDIAGDNAAETHLFHLHNLVLAEGHALLLTTTLEPAYWSLELPDLKSRVQGTQVISLNPPDDELLGAVLGKLFADRQIAPKPEVIPYLVRHMERSFEAAAAMVEMLDKAALDEGRTLSRALAARLIGGGAETS